jgi:hypothetical protein
MLNIEDIKKKLRDFPEPKEIAEIRELITTSFKNLEFIEDGHRYFYHQEGKPDIEMPSVSAICQKFEPKIDWDSIAIKYGEDHKVPVDFVKREWKENNVRSTSNGSLTHLFGEAYMYFMLGEPDKMPSIIKDMQYVDGFLIPYGHKQEAIANFFRDIYDTPNFYPIMPESKICIFPDNKFGIKELYAGTFDMLFGFIGDDGSVKLSILDYKTNKGLKNAYNIAHKVTLLQPFDFLINQSLSAYTIQLNCYANGLKQLGLNIADRKIIWLRDTEKYEKISVPDIEELIIKSLSNENS